MKTLLTTILLLFKFTLLQARCIPVIDSNAYSSGFFNSKVLAIVLGVQTYYGLYWLVRAGYVL